MIHIRISWAEEANSGLNYELQNKVTRSVISVAGICFGSGRFLLAGLWIAWSKATAKASFTTETTINRPILMSVIVDYMPSMGRHYSRDFTYIKPYMCMSCIGILVLILDRKLRFRGANSTDSIYLRRSISYFAKSGASFWTASVCLRDFLFRGHLVNLTASLPGSGT